MYIRTLNFLYTMAIISKIRDKSGLIVFIVGLGLVLFIIPFDTIMQKFGGTGEQPMAEINGSSMYDSEWKFTENVQFESENIRRNNPDYIFTEKDNIDIENSVWGRIITDTLLKSEYAKIGLRVGSKELNDVLIYGPNPSSVIQEIPEFNMDFGGGQKMFLRDSAISFFTNMSNQISALKGNERSNAEANMYFNWTLPITNARLKEKYVAMAKYAVVGTKLEAQRLHKEQNTSAEISYIYLNYLSIADSLVTVTDKDIKDYYDKHYSEVKYKNDGDVRGFKYVLFPIIPSEKDIAEITSNMNNLKEPFKLAANDTAFLGANAASAKQSSNTPLDILPEKAYESSAYNFPIEIDSAIIKGNKGDVIGPFTHMNNSKMVLVKIVSSETKNETEVRHIFLPKKGMGIDGTNLDAAVIKTGDSLVRLISNDKSKFSELSLQFNKDLKNQSGVLMVNSNEDVEWGAEFKNFALTGNIGSVKLVTSDAGFHVVEIINRGDNLYNRIAIVDKDIAPSKTTRLSEVENNILPFITDLENKKTTIEDYVKGKSLVSSELSRLYLTNPTQSMNEIGFSMEILTWAFNRKVGAVSDAILVDGNKIFVGQVTYAASEGAPDFEAAKEDMKVEVLKEKKAEYAMNLIKDAKTLEEAASKLPNVKVESRKIILTETSLVLGQQDPMAVAYAFTTLEGSTSAPIKGDLGIYMITVNSRTSTTASEDLTAQRNEINAKHRNNIEQGYLMALYRAADVKDWRMKRKISNVNN